MNNQRVFLLIGAALLAGFVSPGPSNAQTSQRLANVVQRDEPGFKSIFNGKDLSGWEGNPKLWSVKDGVITGQTTAENPAKGNTFLIWTNGTVADFELRCSFKLVPGDSKGFANSGVQYRSKVINPDNWVVGGYQADMEAGASYTGILYEEAMTRGIMAQRGEKVVWDKSCEKQVTGSVGKAEEIEASIKKGDWNDYVIIAQGNHLQQFVNGKQTVDVTDDCESKRAMSGVIALQLHAGSPMMAQFRNIRIKTLSSSDQSSSGDIKSMQGAWKIASLVANGAEVSKDEVPDLVLNIKDGSYTVVMNSGEIDRGTFTIDSSKQPKQMEVHPEGGPNAGHTVPAIYEMSSEGFKVCYGKADGAKPDSFSPTSEQLLISYKRAKQ